MEEPKPLMKNITVIGDCIVCGSCVNTCPTNAISLSGQTLFYKINVDNSKCISCGACLKKCPRKAKAGATVPLKAYGLIHKEKEKLSQCSSGGFFPELAKRIVSKGGVAYGAAFSKDCKSIRITRIEKVDEIPSISKSKYVESVVGSAFAEVVKDLQEGKTVLYSGTPCQIAGLKAYLQRKDYPNLITCDFACGGLPTHQAYEQYLAELETKFKSPVTSVDFRPKDYGWGRHSITVMFRNGKKYQSLAKLDPYFYHFIYSRYTIRDVCLQCDYTASHISDFTMADFWKWNKLSKFANDGRGISLVHCNSQKSLEIMAELLSQFIYEEIDLEESKYNYVPKPSLSNSFLESRNSFLKEFPKEGFFKSSKHSGMMHGAKALLYRLKTRIDLAKKK